MFSSISFLVRIFLTAKIQNPVTFREVAIVTVSYQQEENNDFVQLTFRNISYPSRSYELLKAHDKIEVTSVSVSQS